MCIYGSTVVLECGPKDNKEFFLEAKKLEENLWLVVLIIG